MKRDRKAIAVVSQYHFDDYASDTGGDERDAEGQMRACCPSCAPDFELGQVLAIAAHVPVAAPA
jgi:hypothetical protein